MIYVNNTFIQINIAPTKSHDLAHAHTRSKHNSKYGIPMTVCRVIFDKINKQLLLGNGECFPLFNLKIVRLLQFLQHIVGGIDSDISIVYRQVKDLMQNRMHIVNGGNLQYFFVSHSVVKTLNIRLFDRSNTKLAKRGAYKHIVHILVILKSIVL